MAERFRPIKKEGNFMLKGRWPVFVLAGVVLAGAVWGLWFFIFKYKINGAPVQKIQDKSLLAVLCREPGDCFWINRQGVAFNETGQLFGQTVLNILDKTGRNIKIGDTAVKPEILAKLLFLRKNILDETSILLVGVETQDLNLADFDFKTSGGWVLKVSLNDNAYKILETLKQALQEITKSGPTSLLDYIDLRIPNKVYYKFK